jgi:hypothetical protein
MSVSISRAGSFTIVSGVRATASNRWAATPVTSSLVRRESRVETSTSKRGGPAVGDEGDDGRVPLAVIGFDGGYKTVDIKGVLSGHDNRFFPDP